jgi:hypothetical protein
VMPADASAATPGATPEDIDLIERSGAIDDISGIAAGLHEIQVAMDEANGGANPLGFDSDAIAMDLDPTAMQQGQGHFTQIYNRAVSAASNTLATLQFAAKVGNKLRYLQNDTDSLAVEAYRQDLDYRNQLIDIFGTPYDGTIGFGKPFPEGYAGPDSQLFAYLDETTIDQFIPPSDQNAPATMVTFNSTLTKAANLADNYHFTSLWANVFGNLVQNLGTTLGNLITVPTHVATVVGATSSTTQQQVVSTFQFGVGGQQLSEAFGALLNTHTYEDFSSSVGSLQIPVRQKSPFAFQAPPEWGQRTSYGKIQTILENELKERIALDAAIKNYQAFLQTFEVSTSQIDNEMKLISNRNTNDTILPLLKSAKEKLMVVADATKAAAETTQEAA